MEGYNLAKQSQESTMPISTQQISYFSPPATRTKIANQQTNYTPEYTGVKTLMQIKK